MSNHSDTDFCLQCFPQKYSRVRLPRNSAALSSFVSTAIAERDEAFGPIVRFCHWDHEGGNRCAMSS